MSNFKYHWNAVYEDNTSLPQYNDDNSENKYADIDRTKLVAFEFYHNDKLLLVCDIASDARLIYRRRVEQQAGGELLVVYLVGWQKTILGKNSQSIACVCTWKDDLIVFLDGWREGSTWFYPVEELPIEK